ncbi:hypothetical protein BH11PSE13_BH11PSE13_04390 [soil metagenome]
MSEATDNDGQSSRYVDLVDAFVQAWDAMTVHPPKDAKAVKSGPRASKEPVPRRAYLLFNRQEDNPLVQSLTERFPKWARDCVTVPDSYFEYREERAPFLLELPEELVIATPGFKRQAVLDWLAQCLEAAASQANERVGDCGLRHSSSCCRPQ